MSYEYKYIPATLVAGARKGATPKDQYVDLFQRTLEEQFYNSSNWLTIEEEITVGSDNYRDVDVRMAHVINAETGLKLGDDWKTLLFQDVSHDIELGRYYIFNDNRWITINTEIVNNLTGTCTIRRCNNTLRWIDELTGGCYEEPCAIEYLVKEPRNYITQGSPFPTPGGFLHIVMQLNSRTRLIKENQRFLFGNSDHWTCYRVIGTGVNDFGNQETFDNESAKVLTLDLLADFVNDELDDIVNGIADVNTNIYSIEISASSVSGSATGNAQLETTITYNGNTVTRDVEWSTSNNGIATIDDGLIEFITNGSCVITANIKNNPASDTCLITVSDTPTVNSVIKMNPDTNYVLEGSTKNFSVYLYENDVVQPDTFVISCNGNAVPIDSYSFSQLTGNTFSIHNTLRDVSSHLTLSLTTGSLVKTQNIYLRGAW